jgi:PD-(D/E)XK nuclease superfamily/Domain of unknown function (DUF2357)
MSTTSPPTSRLRFLDLDANEIAGPREWAKCLIEVLAPVDQLAELRLLRQGEPLRLYAQPLDGTTRLFADWPLSGTGGYRLTLEDDALREELEVSVGPEKISAGAFAQLITDLQTELPASVAIALQKTGAFAGLELRPPTEINLAAELARLRIAVNGDARTVGLASALTAVARDPHQVLRQHEVWVDRSRVRRLEPVGLIAAIRAPNNLDHERRLPLRAPDVRVEQTVDVYENRLVRSYHDQVHTRLRRLHAALSAERAYGVVLEVEELTAQLRRARITASFLDDVGPLEQIPTRTTMVLLRRSDYRSILESYVRFSRSTFVQLDEPGLDAPLENLPHLYQLWGTLQVIAALAEAARECGYSCVDQQLARHLDGGIYVKVLPVGRPALSFRHDPTHTTVKLIPERSYGRTPRAGLGSISFDQIPDISVEVRRGRDAPELYLFDPKYKLRSEEGAEPGDGRAKKVDIDTMHAYRDAIRDINGERAVRYAAILYPGPGVRYGDGIEALSSRPLEPETLRERVSTVLTEALTRA